MRIVSSQKGFWDTTLILFGQQKGIFADNGLEFDIIWTDGGADIQQSIITGSTDFGVAPGILGALSAFAKGAPIAVTNAAMTGSSDLFWYVRSDSPIRSLADCAGKTVAFSRPGASSELIAATLLDHAGVKAKLVGAGGPGATLTQVMSGQIDVGWSAPTVGLAEERAGQLRVIARGNDAPGLASQTVRVGMTNNKFLTERADSLKRLFKGIQQTIEWAYSGDEAVQMYADLNRIDLATGRQARDVNYPKAALALAPIGNLELSIAQAVKDKRLSTTLTPDQTKAFTANVGRFLA
ncbi:MAG: ABC transporter substrate-binding protein [Bosea sp. (in: a-proteobacteria)]|nr:ABC transporter substrate-binding protein [Bosea sp. (in: a-proteobacteria)]